MSTTWKQAASFTDVRYEKATFPEGSIAKITIDRPEVRNAFRPETVIEIAQAMELAREDVEVGVIVLTGEGDLAFCSGGDQRVRGDTGYLTGADAQAAGADAQAAGADAQATGADAQATGADAQAAGADAQAAGADAQAAGADAQATHAGAPPTDAGAQAADADLPQTDAGAQAAHTGVGRFHVTDLHVQIRRLPKPVVAMVAGYAVGGGHVLQLVCDLAIAADNARFGQTGPRVGSFDGGFGASLLAKTIGTRKAKEIWFLCRQYDAQEALAMGLINTVVPLAELEAETVKWCREMLALSPFALRLLKASFNASEDGAAGIQQLAHDANLLFYASDEAKEGREAYKAKRKPEFSRFPRRP